MTGGPQRGILNRPPEHLLVAGLTYAQPEAAACRETTEALRGILRRELRSDLDEIDETTARDAVAPETGELGVADRWDRAHLTVTVGISAAGYDALGAPAGHPDRPADLVPTPWAEFGETPRAGEAQLVLQIASDNLHVAEHVLRRVQHVLDGRITTAWTLHGAQRFGSRAGRVAAHEARSLNGFHDGLSNLDPAHDDDDRALVFVDPSAVAGYPANPPAGPQPAPQPNDPGYGSGQAPAVLPALRPVPIAEPPTTRHGTYMFVRGSVTDTAAWDRLTLRQQEQIIGRWKPSGAFLDRPDDPAHRNDPPLFETDPGNQAVPPGSHARRSNPRGPGDAARRVFRRGYPMILAGETGPLRLGLLFVSFSRTLSTQIEFMMRAWLKNPHFPHADSGIDPLLATETAVLAGGYFFVPPLDDKRDPSSWRLPAA